MNTPRLRRGGGIASSSNLVFYLYWYYFVCGSASEFGAMGSTFWGFSCPNLLLVFLNLLFLGTCIIFFRSVGTSSGGSYFYFIFIFLYLVLG